MLFSKKGSQLFLSSEFLKTGDYLTTANFDSHINELPFFFLYPTQTTDQHRCSTYMWHCSLSSPHRH